MFFIFCALYLLDGNSDCSGLRDTVCVAALRLFLQGLERGLV